MAQDSRLDRYELFVATATVAAHASSPEHGFRHRDVKFLIELFSNWVVSSMPDLVLGVQNTQVARYIAVLADEGFARKLTKRTHPHYLLTRVGLIELMGRIVNRPYYFMREQFFFLIYFLKNYGPRIEALVKAEGKQFPLALKLELEGLLDIRSLILRELASAKRELLKVEARISDARNTSALVTKRMREGGVLEDAVREAERHYPYELNTTKPLTQLMTEIPQDLRQWELEHGNMHRVHEIWEPAHAMLFEYVQQLQRLERQG